jgi:hypothetical protein
VSRTAQLMILGALVALYVVVSAALAIKRRRIARWLASQPEEIQRQLREEHLEYRFARVPNESNVGFSARTAVRIGCLWVNVPIVPLLIAPLAVAQAIEPSGRSILGALLLVLGVRPCVGMVVCKRHAMAPLGVAPWSRCRRVAVAW